MAQPNLKDLFLLKRRLWTHDLKNKSNVSLHLYMLTEAEKTKTAPLSCWVMFLIKIGISPDP